MINVKYRELNKEKLAQHLVKIPLSAQLLGHNKVQSTVKDYIIPEEDNLELQFIVDLFTLTTPEIIDKWYGGEENASELNL